MTHPDPVPAWARRNPWQHTGRLAVVTGARRGLGLAIAVALARDGADVVVTDRSDVQRLAAVCAAIAGLGRRAYPWVGDLSDPAAIERLVACVHAQGRCDILVNNSGIFPFRPLADLDGATFRQVLDVNVAVPFALCRGLRALLAAARGAIVNIGSCSGCPGGASPGGAAYDASKAALHQLTASLAVELGPEGIRVNAIAPGLVATEAMGGDELAATAYGREEIARTALGRLGRGEDIGNIAAFLAGPAAAFITGTVVVADGGALARW